MAGMADVFFKKDTAVLEVHGGKMLYRIVVAPQVFLAFTNTDPDTAAARRAFQHDRIADSLRFLHGLIKIVGHSRTLPGRAPNVSDQSAESPRRSVR